MSQFEKGQRVRMTRKALGQGLDTSKTPRTATKEGVVVGYKPPFVRVLRDEHITPQRYHENFWEAV